MATVAVASTDGININEHFGSAKEYLLYEVDEKGNYELLKKLTVSVNGENADHSSASRRADLLNGVDAVLVAQIGPNAEKILVSKGIKSFSLQLKIDEALKIYGKKSRIIKNLSITNDFSRQASGECSGGCRSGCNC